MNILNSKSIEQYKNPKEITTIRKLFQNYGIEEYEESTLNCMNEFINSYITEILVQSKKNMNLAKRTK
jgi:histone H3/H4